MIKYISLLVVIFVTASWARPKVDVAPLWEDCGTDINRPLTVSFFNVTPNPVEIPGKVKVSMLAVNKRDLEHLKLEMLIERHIWGNYYMTIPCINEQGSCTYEDLCGYLRDAPPHAEDAIKKVQEMFRSAGTPLECPLRAATINVQNFEETLPEVPSFVTYVAVGKYRVTVRFKEPGTNIELGCFRLNVEAKAKDPEEEEENTDDCWFWC